MPLPRIKRGSGTVLGVYKLGSYTAMLIGDAESVGPIKYFYMLSVTEQGSKTPTIVVTLEHNEMQDELLRSAAQNFDEETRKSLLENAPKSYLCMFDKNGGHHIFEQLAQVLSEEQFGEKAFSIAAEQLGIADPPSSIHRDSQTTAHVTDARSINEENEDVRAMMSQVLSDTEEMRDFASANKLPYPALDLGVQEEMYYCSPSISEQDGLRAFEAVRAMRAVIKHMVEKGYLRRENDERRGNVLYFQRYPKSILKEDSRRDSAAAKAWLWTIAIAVVVLISFLIL